MLEENYIFIFFLAYWQPCEADLMYDYHYDIKIRF